MRYKIGICDDDKLQIKQLITIIKNWSFKKHIDIDISSYNSAESFWFHWQDNKDFDILLLDIEMKELNGLELAKIIRKDDNNVSIIFITGFDSYIREGYEVNALNFLIKPVDDNKLYQVLDIAINNAIKKEPELLIKQGDSLLKLKQNEIININSTSNTSKIFLELSDYCVNYLLKDIETQLNKDMFVRCHRSHIVNLKYISKIIDNEIILDNNEKINISRRRRKHTIDKFIKYHKGNIL